MTLEEIDRLAEWREDARDDPDPRDSPYFSRWIISGRMTQDEWGDIELYLNERGVKVESIKDAI